MKEIQRENITHYSVYIAADGTEFLDREECKKYEESAACVLLARIKDNAITTITGGEENFMDENDENLYMTVIPTSQKDIDDINQLKLLCQPNAYILLNDDDINHAILVGYRMEKDKLGWAWFYRVDALIKKILSDNSTFNYKVYGVQDNREGE